jgi:scyllo-inosamine-4-phosphate amidinotransferase 1
MSKVNTHNEWDPLEEVVVGSAIGARWPMINTDLHAIRFRGEKDLTHILTGDIQQDVIEESEEDLNELAATLEKLGIVVHRPEPLDFSRKFATPDWNSDGMYNYCPRDIFLTVGNKIIETPMSFRSRFFETIAYKELCIKCLQHGSEWFSAPKPRLSDEMYNIQDKDKSALNELEPVFDAANVLKIGRDILYLISDTGNELGYTWLQTILGDNYRVHPCRNLYASSHIDTTIVPLKPGVVLVNPSRVNSNNLPKIFKKWNVLKAPEPVDIGYKGMSSGSAWMSLNTLMLRPDLAVVDKHQLPLIRLLEKSHIDIIPLQLRHARTLGGGFHCVTLDIRRKGTLEDYSSI